MKKTCMLLLLALCACDTHDNNINPECLTNITEVQVFDVVGDPDNGPAALAVNCNVKMPLTDDGCIGDTVLLPKGFLPSMQKDQKIKAPRHYCFVKVGEYEYVRNDGKKDKIPVIEYRYNKKILSESDWADILEDGHNKTYTECVHYAAKEFKDAKPEDNDRSCKCFADYMWNGYKDLRGIQDPAERKKATDIFYKTFHAEIKKQCGSEIPDKTLKEMPTE